LEEPVLSSLRGAHLQFDRQSSHACPPLTSLMLPALSAARSVRPYRPSRRSEKVLGLVHSAQSSDWLAWLPLSAMAISRKRQVTLRTPDLHSQA
jgi:hypothetical protein